MAVHDTPLSDNEGTLLALVCRQQPITAYQIAKIYDDSPVSSFSASSGKIYPIARRLIDRGYLRAKRAEGDGRRTEHLEVTEKGQEMLTGWIKLISAAHLLPDDPLRTKLQSLYLLSRSERIDWVVNARVALHEKLEQLERYGAEVEVPYFDLVHENALRSIRTRLEWLDLVLRRVATERE